MFSIRRSCCNCDTYIVCWSGNGVMHHRLLPWNTLKWILRRHCRLIFELIYTWSLNLTRRVPSKNVIIVHVQWVDSVLLSICEVHAIALNYDTHVTFVLVVLIDSIELRVRDLINFHMGFIFSFDINFRLIDFINIIEVLLMILKRVKWVLYSHVRLGLLLWDGRVSRLRSLNWIVSWLFNLFFWRFFIFYFWYCNNIGYWWSTGLWVLRILRILSYNSHVRIQFSDIGVRMRFSILNLWWSWIMA